MHRLTSPSWLAAVVLLGPLCCGCLKRPKVDDAESSPTAAGEPTAVKQPLELPPLGPARKLEKGIDFHEVTLRRDGVPMRVWVYVPEHPADQKLPCVLVAPAGSPLITGMALGEGDRVEHLPYAKAGFVVVSFEMDGPMPAGQPSDRQVIVAAKAFKNAQAGVLNARAAIDFALAKVPAIDPARLYAAGHSSAATLTLLVAADDDRVKACAAFAPVTDVEKRVGRQAIGGLARDIPGYPEFIKASSPQTHVEDLKCPTFLFHATDDSNVPVSETARFAEKLKRTNPRVTFVEVPTGEHYDSMIREGIPRAIKWFRGLRGG